MSSVAVLVADGTEVMRRDSGILDAIRSHHTAGKLLCAICAGPLVLQEAGVLYGGGVTCHPAVKDSVINATYTGERVHMENHILTSQGPGTSFEFALRIIELLQGADAAGAVRAGLILPC